MSRKKPIITPEILLQGYKDGVQLIAETNPLKKANSVEIKTLYSTPCNVGFLNTHLEIVDINETTVQYNGFLSRKDAIGKTAYDITSKNSAVTLIENDLKVLKNEKMQVYEESYRYEEKHLFRCLAFKLPWYSEEGKLMGMFFYAIHLNENPWENIHQLAQIGQKINNKVNPGNIKSFLENSHIQGIKISTREKECLFYLSKGRSIKEIGKILNLSPRTVETHLNHVKYKFNCRTKSELLDLLQNYPT